MPEELFRISYLEHKTNDRVWSKINFLVGPSRDGNLHGLGMSHATTASPKPSFKASWRVGDAVVHRNLFWQLARDGH